MKKRFLWLLMAVFVLAWSYGCEKASLEPTEEGAAEEDVAVTEEMPEGTMAPAALNAGTVVIKSANQDTNVTVEIADTRENRAKGLSGRESLAPNAGMLFIFDEDGRGPFWTKGTYIPLDMIFIGFDKQIVDIKDNVPADDPGLITPGADYRYVLEVNANFAKANDINVGDTVDLRLGTK